MKTLTAWKDQSGYDSITNANAGFSLLLETGDNILTETGFSLLLEDTVITPKEATLWVDL